MLTSFDLQEGIYEICRVKNKHFSLKVQQVIIFHFLSKFQWKNMQSHFDKNFPSTFRQCASPTVCFPVLLQLGASPKPAAPFAPSSLLPSSAPHPQMPLRSCRASWHQGAVGAAL
mmetsp:Transcript_12144/g.16558  ORF Transcript_12144/g.16558 Transcript_12144/m.16558 type:complete len:115 (+) Transcript_12144:401-745(+)